LSKIADVKEDMGETVQTASRTERLRVGPGRLRLSREEYIAKWRARYADRPDHKRARMSDIAIIRHRDRERSRDLTRNKTERMKEWRRANSERGRAYMKNYHALNRERNLKNMKEWGTNNPDKRRALSAKRRARELNCVPPWLDVATLIPVYADAHTKSVESGYKWHVDHIAPLQGKKCSGLHVPWNLRVVPGGENLSKNNKLDPSLLISLEDRQRITYGT